MIKIITSFVTEIFIGIITGVFWNGFLDDSYFASICAFFFLGLIFKRTILKILPPSQPVIRRVFNDYSMMYVSHFGITSFLTGLLSIIQAEIQALQALRPDLNIAHEFNLPSLSPYLLHLCFACLLITNKYFKIEQYYNDDEMEDQTFAIFDDGVCAICLGEHVNASRPRCGHTFCFSCLYSWIQVKKTCPICRGPGNIVTYEQYPKEQENIETFDTFMGWIFVRLSISVSMVGLFSILVYSMA